jgi:hypothetical protein
MQLLRPSSWTVGRGAMRDSVLILLIIAAGGGGYVLCALHDQSERSVLYGRIVSARTAERNSCVREYDARIEGINQLGKERDDREAAQATQLAQQAGLMHETLDLIHELRKFLDSRAKVSDAALVTAKTNSKQTGQLLRTVEAVEIKATAAAAKVDETAIAVKSVNKKLDTATRPTLPAVPLHPYGGGH